MYTYTCIHAIEGDMTETPPCIHIVGPARPAPKARLVHVEIDEGRRHEGATRATPFLAS